MLEAVRSRQPRPLRSLALLAGGALVLAVALVGPAARGDAPTRTWRPARADTDSVAVDSSRAALRARVARADTDSVALGADSLARADSLDLGVLRALADSLDSDSLRALVDSLARADSLAHADTTYRVRRYLSAPRRDRLTASLFPRPKRPFSARLSPSWRHDLQLDSTGTYYVARESVGQQEVRYPLKVTPQAYREQRLHVSLDRNWDQIIEQRARQRLQRQRSGLGVNITVPGGRQSAFTTIFGKNEVDLRVTGQADIKAAFDYDKNDQQLTLGAGSQLTPDFKQDLSLGVTGTIGDKMRVDVNWDTNRDFDYQNQLKLTYTGYEDEIIQKVEAGNVFLQTPSTLIRGGQSLFGIKSEFKIGGVQVTTVASQQEGLSNNLSLEGGAETTQFNLKPTAYDDRTHFFLAYYFRNRWEAALSQPPNILVDGQFQGLTDIEVWKLQPVSPEEQNVRQVVAVVDLGESSDVVTRADAFTRAELPSPDIDQYSDEEIRQRLRPGTEDVNPKDFLENRALMDVALEASDYQVGKFKKLERGRDYDIDEILGFITLKQRMQDSEALAVSFRYRAGGATRQVGDFSSETGGGDNSQNADRLVLKLLRPNNLRQPANLGTDNALNPAAWYLEMRNIYRLGRGLKSNEFDLEVAYQPPGKSATKTLPGITGQQTILQALGLDRVNESGAPRPDNLFDYLPNFTINAGEGLLIFPYLQPFGQRIDSLIAQNIIDEGARQEARAQFVFSDLYTLKKENAQRNTQLDVYQIQGSFKGSIQSFYDLKAFSGLVPGSVRVTSGGTTLQEGADFSVDYQGGTVTITNPAYLTAGRNIEIDYEQNALINLQKKTLLGARVAYQTDERFALGATLMRLSQKSITDKFRIGEEPIANTIWGLDGNLNLEPRWLTRAVDALPLVQTKEPSAITITGEFAQLLPGHTQTNAFEDTQRDLKKEGRNFKPDEREGISYLDDFESFENTFSLMRPGAWLLSAAPVDNANERRGGMAWYQLNINSLDELNRNGVNVRDPAVSIVAPQDVFPNRQTSSQERTLNTMDLFFTPHERGPYNYTSDLNGFLDQPRQAWGCMTQHLSEGYTDFTLRNIEFVEFVFRPFPDGTLTGNPKEIDPGARLYVDLGLISEDIIPDAKLNTEDGLSLTEPGNNFSNRGARLSTGQQDQVINPISGERITEDLGLDGLASFRDNAFAGTQAAEDSAYADFLRSLPATGSNPFYAREVAKARRDPSGDDYHYFLDNTFFNDPDLYPDGASVQQRFVHFFPGQELNSFEGQAKLESESSTPRGNSRTPDSEDLNLNSTLDTDNSYYQYELPLNLATLNDLGRPENIDDFVIEEIKAVTDDGREIRTGWYLVRIPVKKFNRCFGAFRQGDDCVEDFTLIESIRLWTSGHTDPVTVRFATLELVGSQWRKSAAVTNETEAGAQAPLPPPTDTPPFDETRLSISSVNNEENRSYAIPQGTVISQIRDVTGSGPRQAREQSLVMRVENLLPGKQQAIFQTYNQGVDLLKYKHLRMFVHLHSNVAEQPLEEADRDKVKLFVRLGANETNDFYEYEQPLTPSPLDKTPEGAFRADYLWQTNRTFEGEEGVDLNSMNIVLSALNQLKFERDELGVRTDTIFWNDENGVLENRVAEFAPPGTRIGIRGTPSLSRVNTLVIGLRNPASASGDVLKDVEIWVNELRVSGYDENSGFAALLNADVKLADLGRVKANFRRQTDGFGGLASTLGERDQTNAQDWALNTQLNLDKFIPERYGWSIPVTFEVKSSTSTPRFDPNRGDVRVEDLVSAIDENETLTDTERQQRKDQIVESAQTYTFTRSFTTRLQKRGSRSALLRNTLDGTSLSYSYTDSDGRSPNQSLRNSWRWSTSLSYRLNVRRPGIFRPFGFLGDLPVLGALSGLRFNYLPSGVTFTGTASRNFSVTKERPDPLRDTLPDALDPDLTPEEATLIDQAIFPRRPQHTFTHQRQFGLQYSPFGFLNLGFDTNTDQSLNDLGARLDSSTVLIQDGVPVLDERPISALLRDSTITRPDLGVTAFSLQDLQVRPVGNIINDILGGQDPRTERYESRLNATLRPRLDRIKALDWISIQDLGYGALFAWRNGPVGNNFGATVSSSVDLRGGLTVRPLGLFEKFGFYRALQEQQREAEQKARERRDQKALERKQRREERQREREQRRLEEEAGARDEAEGRPPPEEEAAPQAEPAQPPPGQAAPVQPPPEGGQPAPEAAPDTTARPGGLKVPLPNPVGLLRQALLAVTGIEDFRLTYTGNRRSEATNVGTQDTSGTVGVNYSLLDALLGKGPSLGYRLGLERRIDPGEERILDGRVQVTDALTNSDRFQANTRLRLSSTLNVNLTWNVEWASREMVTFRSADSSSTVQTGDNRGSVWAFRASYLDLFKRQLATLRADAVHITPEGEIESTVLTNRAVTQDFLAAYLNGLGPLDGAGRQPFPMPSWQVNYSGITNWPIIRSIAQSAALRHGYGADYGADYRSNPAANEQNSFNLQGGPTIVYTIPEVEVGSVRVNERYQPLIGLDLGFKGGVQTSVAWNTGNTYSLSTTNNIVSETKTNELTVTASYQKQGLKIPFLPVKRLNNRVGFSITVSRSTNDDRTFSIRNAIAAAAVRIITGDDFNPEEALTGDFVQILTQHKRLTLAPKISYQFSNRVSADAFVRYERFEGDSRRPSTTSVNGGFNFRVSISN